ncbi:MAG: hypothetical protein AAFQ50_12075, partial [Pseudomonadota bacterium]
DALNARLAEEAERNVSHASGRLAGLVDRTAQSGASTVDHLEDRLTSATAEAIAAAEARLEAMLARFEATARRSANSLDLSTAEIGKAALRELRAHRAEIREEIRASLTLAQAANDAPKRAGES